MTAKHEKDVDHILPRCRVDPLFRDKNDTDGLDGPWNEHEVLKYRHEAKHTLFGDYFPWEICGFLLRYEDKKTGLIKDGFFRVTRNKNNREEAWENLFGEDRSVARAIKVIKKDWDLDAEGYRKWKKLKARIKKEGLMVFPPGWKVTPIR